MIQVNDDYQGGKIVARYEGPLNSFLFEFGKNGRTEDRESSTVEIRRIVMNKSRKYEVCTYTYMCVVGTFTQMCGV
jgi:hypothetical protein